MEKVFPFKNLTKPSKIGLLALLLAAVFIITASLSLYNRTEKVLVKNLKDRLLSIAVTAAANIDARDLSELRREEDWRKREWEEVVERLRRMKYGNPDIVFMYILRRSVENPSETEFVADADSINPYANSDDDPTNDVDVNRDGKIEPDGPDKLQWPGQPYPEGAGLKEIFLAYQEPVVGDDFYTDSYGTVLTAYAPIFSVEGEVVAVLAADMKVEDFLSITKQMATPFFLFTVLLLLVISLLIFTATYFWERHRHLRETNENVYRHSSEMAVKNKTLVLLEKLYQESISVLSPKATAQNIADVIRNDLNLEFVGMFIFDRVRNALSPLAFSISVRLSHILRWLGFLFVDVEIKGENFSSFLNNVLRGEFFGPTSDISDIWGGTISPDHLQKLESDSHIKTVFVYPLSSGDVVFGVLVLGMNRKHETLSSFEKTSIDSFMNVVSLSLGKAFLYKNLEDANENLHKLTKQRESLVHLVTHKIKGSFTHTKYIFAAILDGSFGEIGEEMRRFVKQGLDSDNAGIETVDLVLNAANLQKGAVKYDMKKMYLRDLVSASVVEKKIQAQAKGLAFSTEIPDDPCEIVGDSFWLKEAIGNLLQNAIKYTPRGNIVVGLRREGDKILFFVRDTGVGVGEEDKKILFTEGGRGKDSVKVNVDSTGYGLYTVRLITEAHNGRVWMDDNKEDGRGSIFYLELPAA